MLRVRVTRPCRGSRPRDVVVVSMQVTTVTVSSILTRCSGFLTTVCSHSLQPYRGCSLGNSLCGAACYVRHNHWLTRGRKWGDFLEVRSNAAEVYRRQVRQERSWARAHRGRFSIFMSSSTEPFLPQERSYGVSCSVLRAMGEDPPDELVVQTHSCDVERVLPELLHLRSICDLRVHLSIETDRERLPGLPPPMYSIRARLDTAQRLREAGLNTVATLSPLYPIQDPQAFFARLSQCVQAVVIDHFVGGDGSHGGARTRRTPVPDVMEALHPGSSELSYRDQVVTLARRHFQGRVGVSIDGFASRYLKEPACSTI